MAAADRIQARLRSTLRAGLIGLDERAVAPVAVRFERPALVGLVFHHVFEDEQEIARELVHPQEAITVDGLKRIVEHLALAGYRFVSLADVVTGLHTPGKYACLTFDDGNASNLLLDDVIRTYRIPVVVFVSTRCVEAGRKFWWDVVHCERRRRGASTAAVDAEIASLERLSPDAIQQHLDREFGRTASMPLGDRDRPLTRQELIQLASHDEVTIGNHSADHVVLTSLGEAGIREQLLTAHHFIEAAVGKEPWALAYPEGAYDGAVVRVVRELGYTCAMTTMRWKTKLPVDADSLLELGRFQLSGTRDLDAQLRVIRSDVQLAGLARRCLRRRRS